MIKTKLFPGSDAKNLMRSSYDFNKKFYNSLGRVPDRCSSRIGKTRGLLSLSKGIGMPSLRCATIDQAMNDEALLLNLDILEEEQENPNEASHTKEGGKLGPKWEGPHEIVEALGKGAYKIRNDNRDILPRTWNVKDLKKCYL
nr:hypothetical protein [Tanacetum cinerariifolium]